MASLCSSIPRGARTYPLPSNSRRQATACIQPCRISGLAPPNCQSANLRVCQLTERLYRNRRCLARLDRRTSSKPQVGDLGGRHRSPIQSANRISRRTTRGELVRPPRGIDSNRAISAVTIMNPRPASCKLELPRLVHGVGSGAGAFASGSEPRVRPDTAPRQKVLSNCSHGRVHSRIRAAWIVACSGLSRADSISTSRPPIPLPMAGNWRRQTRFSGIALAN